MEGDDRGWEGATADGGVGDRLVETYEKTADCYCRDEYCRPPVLDLETSHRPAGTKFTFIFPAAC